MVEAHTERERHRFAIIMQQNGYLAALAITKDEFMTLFPIGLRKIHFICTISPSFRYDYLDALFAFNGHLNYESMSMLLYQLMVKYGYSMRDFPSYAALECYYPAIFNWYRKKGAPPIVTRNRGTGNSATFRKGFKYPIH